MVLLSDWYDRQIEIRLGDRVFKTLITWVHDLPPPTVMIGDIKYVSHIGPELENISDVFIRDPLPPVFQSVTPRCLFLNVLTGTWYYMRNVGERVPIHVKQIQ